MDWVKEKMYQARLQRNRLQENGYIASPDDRLEDDAAEPVTQSSRFISWNQKLSWLAAGVVLGVVVSMVSRVGLIGESDVVSGNTLEQHRKIRTPPAPSNNNEMKEELANLTAQVQALNTTVAGVQATLLENRTASNTISDPGEDVGAESSQQQAKATDTVKQLEVLPPTAAGLVNTDTPEGKKADKTGETTSGIHTASMHLPTVADEIKPQGTSKASGSWVINLVSLPHKIDAERFAEKAKSRGVDAGLYQVTVKGKTYWRVHVSGFSSSAEANSKAEVIK